MREMRDSGVEWIGEIPKDWNCCKQKYRFTLINGRAFKDNEFEEDGTYRILRVGNLFSNPVWYSSSLELEPDKYCEKGDLIYAWSMSYGPYIWNEEKVIYHYHIWKTKLVSDMDKMFSYYYLQALTESIKSQTHETTMGFVTMGIMNNSYIAYPRNIKEQKKISDYLDAKCSKIDEIIEKQLSIIEKLKEYKLSIITEAVTSGINPDVEMKDSGSVWFGNIPINWEMKRLKYVFHIQKDIAGEEGHTVLSITQRGIIPKDFSNNEGQFANSYANYQFDHVEGVVKKVDKNSGQLRDAINDGVGIIITTLQKFPVIYKEVDSAKKRFAIIIDEAHSSQTGDAAKKLKRALADNATVVDMIQGYFCCRLHHINCILPLKR